MFIVGGMCGYTMLYECVCCVCVPVRLEAFARTHSVRVCVCACECFQSHRHANSHSLQILQTLAAIPVIFSCQKCIGSRGGAHPTHLVAALFAFLAILWRPVKYSFSSSDLTIHNKTERGRSFSSRLSSNTRHHVGEGRTYLSIIIDSNSLQNSVPCLA